MSHDNQLLKFHLCHKLARVQHTARENPCYPDHALHAALKQIKKTVFSARNLKSFSFHVAIIKSEDSALKTSLEMYVFIYLFIKFHCIKVVLLISWLSHFPQEAQLSLDSYLILMNILPDRKCQRDPFHERTAAWVLRDKTKHLIWLFLFFFAWKWWRRRNLCGFSEIIAADIKATVRGGDFSVIIFF